MRAAGEYTQKTEWHRITVFRPVLRDVVSQSIKRGLVFCYSVLCICCHYEDVMRLYVADNVLLAG